MKLITFCTIVALIVFTILTVNYIRDLKQINRQAVENLQTAIDELRELNEAMKQEEPKNVPNQRIAHRPLGRGHKERGKS